MTPRDILRITVSYVLVLMFLVLGISLTFGELRTISKLGLTPGNLFDFVVGLIHCASGVLLFVSTTWEILKKNNPVYRYTGYVLRFQAIAYTCFLVVGTVFFVRNPVPGDLGYEGTIFVFAILVFVTVGTAILSKHFLGLARQGRV